MKKVLMVLAVVLLVGAVAVPLMAHGPGGRGGYMMYGRGGGPGFCPYGGGGFGSEYGPSSRGGYADLTTEQRDQLDALHKKFYDETAQLRKDLWDKRDQLHDILNSETPDVEKAKAVQNELSNIRANLSEKKVEFEVEKRKIAPDARFGRGYGYGKGFQRGGGWGGYGPGACWR